MRALMILCLIWLCAPLYAQEREDAMAALSTLEGAWTGQIIIERGEGEPLTLPYDMDVDIVGGDTLVMRHRFHFPNGVGESVEIISYDLDSRELNVAAFAARQRTIQDIKVQEMDMADAPENWRILAEEEGADGRIRHLYQRRGEQYFKYRWVTKKGDGYALSETIELRRQAPR